MPSKKLAAYRAKRDFSRTREPSGDEKVAAAPQLRFVIQKHAATRLHYDFRLELERRLQVLGGDARALARSARQAPGGRGRGPSARLWRLRRHHPQGPVWRRHGDAVGPRLSGRRKAMPTRCCKKGDLKFVLEGEKLHGSWVLVRMRNDRSVRQGKRTNWLLIKHRDQYAEDGDGEASWRRIIRSRRAAPWRQIAAGKGKKPKAFMRAQKRCQRDAVWNSRKKSDADSDAKANPRRAAKRSRIAAALRRAAAVPRWWSARRRARAGCMRSSSTAIACSCASKTARRVCAPARAWTGPTNSPPSPRPAKRLPDCILDGEIVALDHNGAPDFAGAAGGAVGREDRRRWSSSSSICCSPTARTCAPCR